MGSDDGAQETRSTHNSLSLAALSQQLRDYAAIWVHGLTAPEAGQTSWTAWGYQYVMALLSNPVHKRLRDGVEFIAGIDGTTNNVRGIINLAWIGTQTMRQRLTDHI
eukprot:4804658-Pyramimonas_sp.AAC.1